MQQKAFTLVSSRLYNVLKPRGFVKEQGKNDLEIIFKNNNNMAYKLAFDTQNNRYDLSSAISSDIANDYQWKSMSTWLFDPQIDTMKSAENIADDFVQTLARHRKNNAIKKGKKKKKDEDNYVDAAFLVNRLVSFFPELRDDIANEKETYQTLRCVTFTKEKIVPKINQVVANNWDSATASKLFKLLSDLYNEANLDARGIITFVILNSIDDKQQVNTIEKYLSDDLRKTWTESRKLKGKNIKPERKKKKSLMSRALDAQQS